MDVKKPAKHKNTDDEAAYEHDRHCGDNRPYVQMSTLALDRNGIFHCFRLPGALRYENYHDYLDSLVLFRAP